MHGKIWLTVITSILLCLVYPYFCSEDANDFVGRIPTPSNSPQTSQAGASSGVSHNGCLFKCSPNYLQT
uniref:Secreted protein n=1 Tax=Trichobilharzia regenti TaxID=157069 RepID=A0AA85IRU1_TRIRE|nr:unnamed protein product [Trichobilharzia regenti]